MLALDAETNIAIATLRRSFRAQGYAAHPNPSCVNPDHIFAGTDADNKKDSVRKGRHVWQRTTGEDHPSAKLNWNAVAEIRQKYASGDISIRELAAEYGVTHPSIWKIVSNQRWK